MGAQLFSAFATRKPGRAVRKHTQTLIKDVPKYGGQRAIGADNLGKICRGSALLPFILRVRPLIEARRLFRCDKIAQGTLAEQAKSAIKPFRFLYLKLLYRYVIICLYSGYLSFAMCHGAIKS